jgi:hypothetical protein
MNSIRTFSVKDRFLSRPSCKRGRAGIRGYSNLNVDRLLEVDNSRFLGSPIGTLLAGKPKAHIHDSYFNNQTNYSILSFNSYTTDQDVEIDNNSITDFQTGIFVFNWFDGTNKVHHNTLSANPATNNTIGILAASIFPNVNEDNKFASNTITDVNTGIYGMGQVGSLLFDNHIFSAAATGFTGNAGIKLENSFMNWIQENETGMGTGSTGFFNFGFWNKLSPYNWFFCNQMHDQGIGMLSDGSNEPNSLVRGDYQDNGFDLTLLNGGNVGDIGVYDPSNASNNFAWDNTFTSSGLIDILSWNTNSISKRFVKHSSFGGFDPTTGTIGNAIVISEQTTSNHLSNTFCTDLPDPSYFALPPMDERKPMALNMLNDTVLQPLFPQSLRWMQKFNLYRILEGDTILQLSDDDLESYFNINKTGNIGIISRAMKAYSDSIESSIKIGILANYTDSLLALVPENICEQTLIDFLSTINQFSFEDRTEIDTTEDRMLNFLNNWLDSNLFASIKQIKPFSYSQIAKLDEIAQKCPYESGPAVMMARAALVLVNGDPFHYSNSCEEFEEPELRLEDKPNQANSQAEVRINLYPNPANDRLFIDFFGFETIDAQLEIRDIQGRKLLESKLVKNTTIQTSTLSNGLYLVTVRNLNNFVVKTKIVINR